MKKSTILLDAFILLAVSTLFVWGLDSGFKFLKGEEKKDSPIILPINNSKPEKEIIKILDENKKALISLDEHERTPLMRICNVNLKSDSKRVQRDEYLAPIVTLLVERGASLEAKDKDGWTALMWAAWSNIPSTVTSLIAAGADINVQDRIGNTPLSIALAKKNEDVAALLDSPLMLGIIKNESPEKLKALIAQPGALEKKDNLGRTPLMLISNVNLKEDEKMKAIDSYLASAAKMMIEGGANLDEKDKEGKTALIWAASSNLSAVAATLLEAGADINAQDDKGNTAMAWASRKGRSLVFDTLVKSGADLNLSNEDSYTPLTHAVAGNQQKMVSLLIEAGADTDVKDKKDYTLLKIAQKSNSDEARGILQSPLVLAVITKQPAARLEELAKEKNALTMKDDADRTPLLIISSLSLNSADEDTRLADAARLLVKLGADINARDHEKRTALMLAVQEVRPALVSALIDLGIDVNALDEKKDTALHWCLDDRLEGNLKVLDILLKSPIDKNAKDADGLTPLSVAINKYLPDAAIKIISSGADISIPDKDGHTPLMWAARNGLATVTQALLNAKADVAATDEAQCTALMWAARGNQKEILIQMIQAGANLNTQDKDGATALIWAARQSQEDALLELINAGADLNTKDKNGQTALMWATKEDFPGIVKILLEKGADTKLEDKKGNTALTLAQKNNFQDIIDLLQP